MTKLFPIIIIENEISMSWYYISVLANRMKGAIIMAKTFKHLTIDDRLTILTEVKYNTPLKEIAKKIKKDPTTISKEIKLHRYLKEVTYSNQLTCGYNCKYYESCKIQGLCKYKNCKLLCKSCKNINCNKLCLKFIPYECKRLKRFPYVCNGCEKNSGCKRNRYYYDPKIANNEYLMVLKESRTGIDIEETSFKQIDSLITDGVKKGKSIYSILINHPEINISERTIYRYVERKYLSITNIDLRNKVKMKPRFKYKIKNTEEKRKIIQNRTYNDYINFIADNPSLHGAQLDLVFGKQEEKSCFMNLIFPFMNFMISYILPNKEANTIIEAFNHIEDLIGFDNFTKLFPYILTDRGSEFMKALEIETSHVNGKQRTKLFYCDAYTSSQKAQIERNQEFMRFYYPQGESILNVTQEMTDLMSSHINSYPREVKNNYSPIELFKIIYGDELLIKLNIKHIKFDDIILNKSLFKK